MANGEKQRVTIPVELATASYEVIVQPGLLNDVAEFAAARRVGIITDENVAAGHYKEVETALLREGIAVRCVTVQPGESAKSLKIFGKCMDMLLGEAWERSMPILSLGGGVITDLGGFVAASLLRGVPHLPMPTSLLAMVDASVGGKTGLNHASGKNLIGAFHHPRQVLIDPNCLKTLPTDQLIAGLAECIKHAVIRDAELFADMERELDDYLALDVPKLADLIARNVTIKARVVMADPYEKGERAHLNFGHTFAHAFERVSAYAIGHGEAVGVGMVCACRLAERLGMFDEAARVEKLIARSGLTTGGLNLEPEACVDAMSRDKKVKDGKIRFILPTKIGAVTIRDDVERNAVVEVVKSVCE